MQQNDKKIKELLNEHIRERSHSPENPAGLYSGGTTPSRASLQDSAGICALLLHASSPAAVVDTNVLIQNCKADTAKRSMFLHIASHAFVAHKKML